MTRVEQLARNAIERLDYFGIGEAEILRDKQTGEDYLIEINARPWLQYALAPASNHDFLGLVLGLPLAANQPPIRARENVDQPSSRSFHSVLPIGRHGQAWTAWSSVVPSLNRPQQCFRALRLARSAAVPAVATASMSRNALMIAFHFPPFARSSGSIRTLSFVRRLPEYDWQPVVLTATPNAYPEVDDRSLASIPPSVRVVRAGGLDVARHLAIAGRYPTWLATPDRWNTWAAAAFVAGLACIRRDKPSVIWATFPIASSLLVAIALHKVTKVPLVVDLRDPMIYEGWPENRWIRATYTRIETRAAALASAVIVTTPSARRLYVQRYPHLPESRFRMIANGVDEAMERCCAPHARDLKRADRVSSQWVDGNTRP